MTIEHILEYGTGAGPQPRWAEPREARHAVAGLLRWVQASASRSRANRMLKRSIGRPQHVYIDEMPAYLRRDIGLPSDLR